MKMKIMIIEFFRKGEGVIHMEGGSIHLFGWMWLCDSPLILLLLALLIKDSM